MKSYIWTTNCIFMLGRQKNARRSDATCIASILQSTKKAKNIILRQCNAKNTYWNRRQGHVSEARGRRFRKIPKTAATQLATIGHKESAVICCISPQLLSKAYAACMWFVSFWRLKLSVYEGLSKFHIFENRPLNKCLFSQIFIQSLHCYFSIFHIHTVFSLGILLTNQYTAAPKLR